MDNRNRKEKKEDIKANKETITPIKPALTNPKLRNTAPIEVDDTFKWPREAKSRSLKEIKIQFELESKNHAYISTGKKKHRKM